jgi:hypothetical protein
LSSISHRKIKLHDSVLVRPSNWWTQIDEIKDEASKYDIELYNLNNERLLNNHNRLIIKIDSLTQPTKDYLKCRVIVYLQSQQALTNRFYMPHSGECMNYF